METNKIKITIEQCPGSDMYYVKLTVDGQCTALTSNSHRLFVAKDIEASYKLAFGLLEKYVVEVIYSNGARDCQTLALESFEAAFKYASELIKGHLVASVNVRKNG